LEVVKKSKSCRIKALLLREGEVREMGKKPSEFEYEPVFARCLDDADED
jgi:hypothetical protein